MRTTRKKGGEGGADPAPSQDDAARAAKVRPRAAAKDPRMAFFDEDPDPVEDAGKSKVGIGKLSMGRAAPGSFPDGKTLSEVVAKDQPASPFESEDESRRVQFVDPAPHLGGRTGPVPTAGQFRVLKTRWVSSGGYRALLRQGDTINASSYDMKSLLEQGIELEEV